MLDLLSVLLSGQPYKPLGAPASYHNEHTGQLNATQLTTDKNPDIVRLALKTLGTFDLTGHVLNEFVRSAALPYLEDDNPSVRAAAAETCCTLFIKDPICYQASSQAIEIISDVLDKLLTVGIADPDATIRNIVLRNLHERFDSTSTLHKPRT